MGEELPALSEAQVKTALTALGVSDARQIELIAYRRAGYFNAKIMAIVSRLEDN